MACGGSYSHGTALSNMVGSVGASGFQPGECSRNILSARLGICPGSTSNRYLAGRGISGTPLRPRCANRAAKASVLVRASASLPPLAASVVRMNGSINPMAICWSIGRASNAFRYSFSGSTKLSGSVTRSVSILNNAGFSSPRCTSDARVCHAASANTSRGLVPTSMALSPCRV